MLQWLNEGLPKIKVSVNFSSIQFFERDFVEKVLSVINEFELKPHFLIMEVTESVLMVEAEKAVSVIRKLQSYGIQIALDDFGTGFSSLAYLSNFNIDILKVAGSFIKNAILCRTSSVITKSIVNMARELKIKVVAEGIEKQEQLSYLQELDCHTGQGYLYCRPLFSEEFAAVLSKGKCEPLIYKERRKFMKTEEELQSQFLHLQEASLTRRNYEGKVNIGNTRVMLKISGLMGYVLFRI